MKKLIILLLCCGIAACSSDTNITDQDNPELTLAHLDPITVCGTRKSVSFDEEIEPQMNLLLRDWYSNILTLNRNCIDREVKFEIKEFDFITSVDKKMHETTYTQKISAKVSVRDFTGEKSKATSKTENTITFDSAASLADKETYKLKLYEETINDFDKVMRKSIKKYLLARKY